MDINTVAHISDIKKSHKWSMFILNIASLLSSMDEEVETAFLGTRSGLMRFQRYTGIEKRVAKYVDNLKK